MMSDVPWGVLLSGGLDSSLVASCASRHAARCQQQWPRLHSFSVGLKGSPDLAAAKKVAAHLGTQHHSFEFTVQEGLDAIEDVIHTLETYDTTTIRAATPMYLMARKIKAGGVKMVISGEGADEALAGYLYFHKAPNKEALHKETVSKLQNLHYFDCLRANKAMSAFGVEPRVPFLDRDFLEYVMTIDPEWKMCKIREGDEKRGKIEKFILRKAFDTPDDPYLPEEILWRQKEQFSDGVGYSWIDSLRARAQERVTDQQWETRAKRFPYNTPTTREAYNYREIFEQHYPSESSRATVPGGPSVACSTPAAIEWDEAFKKLAAGSGGECSGRSVAGVHESAYSDALKVAQGEEAALNNKKLKSANGV
jgi:asparagine synthase (glutamine-hydrolysing)